MEFVTNIVTIQQSVQKVPIMPTIWTMFNHICLVLWFCSISFVISNSRHFIIRPQTTSNHTHSPRGFRDLTERIALFPLLHNTQKTPQRYNKNPIYASFSRIFARCSSFLANPDLHPTPPLNRTYLPHIPHTYISFAPPRARTRGF